MSRTVLLWLICGPLWLSAQIRVQVTLTDQEGEALAFAHIHDLSRQQVTVTDAYGRANLSMTPGNQQLRCSYTGLKDSLWQGLILRDTLLVIRLEPLVLAEVVVKARPLQQPIASHFGHTEIAGSRRRSRPAESAHLSAGCSPRYRRLRQHLRAGRLPGSEFDPAG